MTNAEADSRPSPQHGCADEAMAPAALTPLESRGQLTLLLYCRRIL
ncbi:MAG: hypothetical protein WC709_11660 [Thermoleophilia bacterium]